MNWKEKYYEELYELYHHGIKGQRWGIRRFQNKDGSLTPAGKNRYGEDRHKEIRNATASLYEKYDKEYGASKARQISEKTLYEKLNANTEHPEYERLDLIATLLEEKVDKQVDKEMREKFGKDYDEFLRREKWSSKW